MVRSNRLCRCVAAAALLCSVWFGFDHGLSAQSAPDNIVLHAGKATPHGVWQIAADATAASGLLIRTPDAGAPKKTAPAANPVDYFELTFDADAGTDYHVWVRGKALNNYWGNDSIWIQFDKSLDLSGTSNYRIGTTAGIDMNLEECSGCGESGWGWEDNGWHATSANVPGPHVRFAASGTQVIRVQTREDGFSIDQIVLSKSTYLNTRPGAQRNDTTILLETGGGGAGSHEEIVLYTADIPPTTGWERVADSSAAKEAALWNRNLNAAKITQASAAPARYFEAQFTADANREYHVWVRGKAEGNSYSNDSFYVQFSGTVDLATGTASKYRIGTTDAIAVVLEEGYGLGVSGWGWADNEYLESGTDGLGENIRFATSGPQTIRIQQREDGVTIDQIVLSAGRWVASPPGLAKNDATILNPDGSPQDPGSSNQSPVFDADTRKAFRVSTTTPAWSGTTNPIAPVTIFGSAKASDPEGQGVSYQWSFGSDTKAGPTVPHTFSTGGTRTVRVTASDGVDAVSRETTVAIASPVTIPSTSTRLRVLSWNIFKARSSTEQYDLKLQARWIHGMQPDVIVLNEVLGKNCTTTPCPSGARQAQAYAEELNRLYENTGTTWYYEHAKHDDPSVSNDEGVAILSRFQLSNVDSEMLLTDGGTYDDRVALAATISVNGRQLVIVSAHFTPYTENANARRTQGAALRNWLDTDEKYRLIPNRILAGDFNGDPGEIFWDDMTAVYQDSWDTASGMSPSRATAFPANTSGRTRAERIDYVFTAGPAFSVLAAQVPDTRDYTDPRSVSTAGSTSVAADNEAVRASDHYPIVVTLEVKQ